MVTKTSGDPLEASAAGRRYRKRVAGREGRIAARLDSLGRTRPLCDYRPAFLRQTSYFSWFSGFVQG